MKFPCLVQKRFCTTDIRVRAESEERNVYGEPSVHEYAGKCNWQNKGKVVFTADKIAVNITGTAYFPGDILPDMPTITGGTVEVFGEKREIFQVTKARNPDGTVNYTFIEVK